MKTKLTKVFIVVLLISIGVLYSSVSYACLYIFVGAETSPDGLGLGDTTHSLTVNTDYHGGDIFEMSISLQFINNTTHTFPVEVIVGDASIFQQTINVPTGEPTGDPPVYFWVVHDIPVSAAAMQADGNVDVSFELLAGTGGFNDVTVYAAVISGEAQDTPEPSVFFLLGLMAAGLGVKRSRR